MNRTIARWSATGAFAALCCIVGCTAEPKYEVEAQLLVVKKTPESVFGHDNRDQFQEDYVSSIATVIKSPTIINRVLKQPNIKGTKIASRENAASLIGEGLKVRRLPDSKAEVVALSLRWDDEQEGVTLMEAIIKVYQLFLDETYKNLSDKSLEMVLTARQTLKESLDRAEQDYQDFRLKKPFLLNKDQLGANHHAANVRTIEARQMELRIKKTELDKRLARVKSGMEEKPPPLALTLKAYEWAAKSGFDKLPPEARKGKDAVAAYAEFLSEEIHENQLALAVLNEVAEIERKQARDLADFEAHDERMRRKVALSLQMFDSITKRVNELGLGKDWGGYDARQVMEPRAKKVK